MKPMLLFVLTLSISSSCLSQYVQHESFDFLLNTWQNSTDSHGIITLSTASPFKECAGYCTLRNTDFGSNDCEAFFVLNLNSCHLVPAALKTITQAKTGINYYMKASTY